MEPTLTSNSNSARLAAFLFLFVCLPTAIWSDMTVPSKIFVAQDPSATANNLLANESLFRTAMVVRLGGYLVFVFMMMLFYKVLRAVDSFLALLMLLPIIAQIPVVFFAEVFSNAALMTLKGNAPFGFETAQQHEMSYYLLRWRHYITGPTKFFIGLSFVPMGILILRSGLAPRLIGVLLLISATGYIVDSACYFLLQRAEYLTVSPWLKSMFLGFMISVVWFLIKGVRNPSAPVGRHSEVAEV
jgi:hypothetical protein